MAAALAAASVAALLAPGSGTVRLLTVVPQGRSQPSAGEGRPGSDRTPSARRTRAGAAARAVAAATTARAAAAAAGCLVFGTGPVVALLAALGAAAAGRWWTQRARAAALAHERARAVEACAALAGELRAGRPPARALSVAAEQAAGASQTALTAAAAAAGLGGDVAQALLPAAGDAGAVPQVLRALAACWTVCAGSGGGLAAAVERLEQGLRAEQDRRRVVQAELAGPRATAGMLAVLPGAGLLLAAGLGADPLHVLLETPVGLVCLFVGLGLDGLGLLWTGRLVRRAGGGG